MENFMPTVAEKTNRINEAIYMLQQLPPKEQESFLEELKTQFLIYNAKRLDAAVEPSDITMDEIVEDVREVRRERAEKRKMELLQWKE